MIDILLVDECILLTCCSIVQTAVRPLLKRSESTIDSGIDLSTGAVITGMESVMHFIPPDEDMA